MGTSVDMDNASLGARTITVTIREGECIYHASLPMLIDDEEGIETEGIWQEWRLEYSGDATSGEIQGILGSEWGYSDGGEPIDGVPERISNSIVQGEWIAEKTIENCLFPHRNTVARFLAEFSSESGPPAIPPFESWWSQPENQWYWSSSAAEASEQS